MKASRIVEVWQIQQTFVGAVIVAFGTSLPELALTVTAALKDEPGLSIGNIVGSNVFDCLVPIGVGTCIAPLQMDASILHFDLLYLLVVSGIFSWLIWRKGGLHRCEGAWVCGLYVGYMMLKVSMD